MSDHLALNAGLVLSESMERQRVPSADVNNGSASTRGRKPDGDSDSQDVPLQREFRTQLDRPHPLVFPTDKMKTKSMAGFPLFYCTYWIEKREYVCLKY